MSPALATDYLAHHLRLLGFDAAAIRSAAQPPPGIRILVEPAADELAVARAFATDGGVVVAIRPGAAFSLGLGVEARAIQGTPPFSLHLAGRPRSRRTRLRTLHAASTYHAEAAKSIVIAEDGEPAWLWLPLGRGGLLLVGTDLHGDLLRYRQGDPDMAAGYASAAVWGYDNERPLHLFEGQIAGEHAHERHADAWAFALADVLAARASLTPAPLLPGGAPGAIVITGDDDQAYLEKYDEQLALLAGTPVTYFLHPKTRHTRGSLKRLRRGAPVDLGIHPDALDAPDRYGALLREQVEWFERLVQAPPVSVRNHGFLSSGYWRHVPHWIEEGIQISSNIPGLDGRVLNGSLLPARIVYDAELTSHWSLLTAIGDGVVFVQGKQGERAADCVHGLVQEIRDSCRPGVVVLNLHPQNVVEARSMHRAALEAISGGFHPWTMRECLEWFQQRDGSRREPAVSRSADGPFKRIAEWFR